MSNLTNEKILGRNGFELMFLLRSEVRLRISDRYI